MVLTSSVIIGPLFASNFDFDFDFDIDFVTNAVAIRRVNIRDVKRVLSAGNFWHGCTFSNHSVLLISQPGNNGVKV